MVIQMNVKNELGDFNSEQMTVTLEQYKSLIEISKRFYLEENGFEMWLENGFMVIPPEITKRSILSINILQEDEE